MRNRKHVEEIPAENARPAEQRVGDAPPTLMDKVLAESSGNRSQPALATPVGFSPCEIGALQNQDVVEILADDAPFLWLQRCRAVKAPHYALSDIRELDMRLLAPLEGLLEAGTLGWELNWNNIHYAEPGEVFTAAWLAFRHERVDWFEQLCAVVAPNQTLQDAVTAALSWLPWGEASAWVDRLWRGDEPWQMRIAIATGAAHRKVPQIRVMESLYTNNVDLQVRACKAAYELGLNDLVTHLNQLAITQQTQSSVRFWSGAAAAMLGSRDDAVVTQLIDEVSQRGDYCWDALEVVMSILPAKQADALINRLMSRDSTRGAGLSAIGLRGVPRFIPELIKHMDDNAMARIAGEAYSMITGADLAYLDLDWDGPEPPDDEDDPLDTTDDYDEDLPWPRRSLVAAHWNSLASSCDETNRYLCGLPYGEGGFRHVLSQGKQRQRIVAARELMITAPGTALIETRARGDWQWRRRRDGFR